MAHVRATIRDNAVTAVTGLGATVKATRKYPVNAAELPRIHVYATSETVDEGRSTLATQTRILSLVVECIATATEDALDDTMDAFAELVEVELTGSGFSASVLDSQLTTTEIEVDSSGDVPVGVAVLTFNVLYRVNRGSPQTAI